MNKRTLAILMAAMLASPTLHAEEASGNYMGQEVVVSATKTLNSIANAGGSSVTVITAEEIKQSGKPTVEEVIKGAPGIDVVSNGGLGTTTSVFLRGADAKNVLVLMDGVPLNDPSAMGGVADIANLTVDNIERIEIVRGPVSVLYGSHATAGIINIITKQGKGKPAFALGAEGGAFGTWKANGGASGKIDGFRYSVNLARLKSDGFSIVDERNPDISHPAATADNDGYRNTSVSTNLGYQLGKNVDLSTVLRYTDASADLDGYYKYTDAKELSGRVALRVKTDSVTSTFYDNYSSKDRKYYSNTSVLSSAYKGYINEFGWQGDAAVASNNTVTIGANLQNERINNQVPSVLDKNVDFKSVFVQDQWHIKGVDLVAGLRHDDHELFGGKTTWRIAPSYRFDDTTLKCSYGTGFRAPTLYELYDSVNGNSQLKPETSKGWDAGFEQNLSRAMKFGSTFFQTDYEDIISWVSSGGMTGHYQQLAGKTAIKGVESFLEWQPKVSLSLNMNYTYTYTKDADGKQLARRPKHKASLSASWKANRKFTLTGNAAWVGTRIDTYAPDKKLDSYFLANISASYKLQPNVELYGRIDNLFDEYYEEAWSYATPGRSAYAGVKITL